MSDDPSSILDNSVSSAPSRRVGASQIISWLLYPVILALGFSGGFVIGVKQGQSNPNLLKSGNQNVQHVNSSIVPNVNNKVNTNTTNANTNISNAFINTNNALGGGEYLSIDAQTQSKLNADEQSEKDLTVDQSASVTDILRQQDLISLKYDLKAYYLVHNAFPDSHNEQIKLERGTDDIFYQSMKIFYGGSYNQPIDPQAPTYYYGYTSDGSKYELTAYLVSKKKVFILKGP